MPDFDINLFNQDKKEDKPSEIIIEICDNQENIFNDNPQEIIIEINGLKTLNSFISLSDTPLYYENGKFFKVENSKIIYTDITWEDITGSISDNKELKEQITEIVKIYSKDYTEEAVNTAVNTHNTDETAHEYIQNKINDLDIKVDENIENINTNILNITSNIEQNKTDLNNLSSEFYNNKENVDNSLNTIENNISNLTNNLADINLDLNNKIQTNATNINNLSETVISNYDELSQKIGNIKTFNFIILDELPEIGESNHIYLIPNKHSEKDVYDEYIWIEDTQKFEFIGNTEADLSNYYNKTEIDNLFKETGSNLEYNNNVLSLNNKSGDKLSEINIKSAPDVDNKTIQFNSNKELETFGNLTKDGTFKYDWIGTEEEYNAGVLDGTITPNTMCLVTDDEETGIIDIPESFKQEIITELKAYIDSKMNGL